jgi:hypothetical protein
MTDNVYKSIFSKLKQIGILDESGIMQVEYMKFKSYGLMDLNVDRLAPDRIALAHNGIQNGDLMADPDVEVQIHPENKRLKHLLFKMTTWVFIK